MRVNPRFANQQYIYANDDKASGLPEGTYSNMAAKKYVKDNDKDKDGRLSQDEVTLSKEAFDKLDKDKSGKLDLKEMKAGLQGQDAAIEEYYKKNKSNSKKDATAGLLGNSADQLKDMYGNLATAKYIKENDKNKDSALSRDEVSLSKEAFARLDKDKDGKLESDEIQAGLKGQEDAIEAYYEANGTGSSITKIMAGLLSNASPTKTATPYSAKAAASLIGDRDADRDSSLSRTEAGLSTAAFAKLDTDKNGKLNASEVQAGIKAKEKTFATYYKNKVSNKTIASLTSNLLKTI